MANLIKKQYEKNVTACGLHDFLFFLKTSIESRKILDSEEQKVTRKNLFLVINKDKKNFSR